MTARPAPDPGRPPAPERTYSLQDLLGALHDPSHYDIPLITKAYEFAREHHEGQVRISGLPYINHLLAVATILANLRMDTTTIVAGLLHDVIEDTEVGLERLRSAFGDHVAEVVDGVSKISGLEFRSAQEHQAENWRKMLLAIAKDLRVVLIKLADRVHNMRTIQFLRPDKQERIARETLDIYAPLAHRFGIAAVKWELEDLALKTLEPAVYHELMEKVAMKKEERERFLRKLTEPLSRELEERGIKAELQSRAKHFYSIYMKMVTRTRRFEDIHDLMAVRVIVPSPRECYETLGVIHALWKPVPERIKDYIASPKLNHYRSLHTTVIGPERVWVEFQIRTPEMHREAEFGIAAHWVYKEGKPHLHDLIGSFPWLGELVKEQADQDAEEFFDLLKSDLFQQEVFVFTPKGDLKVLPKRSTPIDFAYLIHTEVGNHCAGARVNDRIVPLRYQLESGDTVEIITSPSAKPSQDWVHIVATAGARSKIRRHHRQESTQHSISLGREMLEREARRQRLNLEDALNAEAARGFGFDSVEKLYQMVGEGNYSAIHVIRKLFPDAEKKEEPSGLRRILTFHRRKDGGVRVQGVANVMLRFAHCCQPVPGESIIGIVTRGRGIAVHRSDCPNTFPPAVEMERRIEVNWDVSQDEKFRVDLRVEGEQRKGLLADVSAAISGLDTNILSASMEQDGQRAVGSFVVEVQDLPHLRQVLKVVKKVRGVVEVFRVDRSPESK
jgi:GTP pyrophosphokinase